MGYFLFQKAFIFIYLALFMKLFRVIIAFVILIGFFFEFAVADAYPVINEIMYDPSSGVQGGDTEMEWVELYSDDEVNLSKYYLDGKSLNGSFNGYLIIAKNKDKFLNYYKEEIDCGVIDVNIVLSNEGRKINLSNLTYEEVIEYSPSIGGKGNGKTLERVNPRNVEFKEGLVIGGSPCRENSVFVANVAPASPEPITSSAPPTNIPNAPENNLADNGKIAGNVIVKQDYNGVKIIGIMPNPEGEDNGLMPNGEWIELYNSGNLAVNLSGLLFYDAAGNVLKVMENNTAIMALQPGASTKVYRNGNNKFSLNNNGDEITLESFYDEVVDNAVYAGSKEGLILRKVNDEWVSEEKPKSEQKEVSKSSSNGRKSKASKIEVISAPKAESGKTSKVVKQEKIATTTTIIAKAVESGVVYRSKDKKAAESGIMFFGFTIFLLIIVLLFKKDF